LGFGGEVVGRRRPQQPGEDQIRERPALASRWWHCIGSKDARFGEGKKKLTWRGRTHELEKGIGKLLEQIVF
jgi:hypothetical protein